MGKCIVSISKKIQRYTVYLYLETALHVSGGTSTHHQELMKGRMLGTKMYKKCVAFYER
jgi:hypothetical protein